MNTSLTIQNYMCSSVYCYDRCKGCIEKDAKLRGEKQKAENSKKSQIDSNSLIGACLESADQ
eukprot:Awhi_evm1s118